MRVIGSSFFATGVLGMILLALPGCIQKVPSDVVEAIESLDRNGPIVSESHSALAGEDSFAESMR